MELLVGSLGARRASAHAEAPRDDNNAVTAGGLLSVFRFRPPCFNLDAHWDGWEPTKNPRKAGSLYNAVSRSPTRLERMS